MKRELERLMTSVVKDLFSTDIKVELTRPDPKFGDYATNVALQLAQKGSDKPHELATQLVSKIKDQLGDKISEAVVAGPGFINITLEEKYLLDNLPAALETTLSGQVIVAEYSDPNPFK